MKYAKVTVINCKISLRPGLCADQTCTRRRSSWHANPLRRLCRSGSSVSGAGYAFKLSHNSFAPLFDHDAITLTRRRFGEGIPKMMEAHNEFLPSVLPFSFAHHLHCAIVTQSANQWLRHRKVWRGEESQLIWGTQPRFTGKCLGRRASGKIGCQANLFVLLAVHLLSRCLASRYSQLLYVWALCWGHSWTHPVQLFNYYKLFISSNNQVHN